MKKTIPYWVCTGLAAFSFLPGGIVHLLRMPETVQGITALGYPEYFVPILGVAKIAGAIVMLAPKLPRLKEWAYAGMIIDLVAASVSHVAMHSPAWHVIMPMVVGAFVMGSWALRPDSRKLGVQRSAEPTVQGEARFLPVGSSAAQS